MLKSLTSGCRRLIQPACVLNDPKVACISVRMASNGPLKALFDNMNAKANKKKEAMMESDNMDDVYLPGDAEGATQGTKKRLSIERIYQKKSQLEHILLRPDSYIGSVEPVTQPMWVYNDLEGKMVQKDITFVPGLYKIFDEIIVNAADHKQKDPNMSVIKIDIDPENNKIKIWNNGQGIPVVQHKEEKMFVPTMIFGHLLTSSNYDDTEKKVTGGRNGYGAKLCNIFSTKFIVETSSKDYKKAFKQTWIDNMKKTKDPTITDNKAEDFTCITFHPDLPKFKMETLDKDTVELFTRRAYDIAASSKGVKVYLNGKKIAVKGFKDYIDLYTKDRLDDTTMQPLKVVYEQPNQRWEVGVTLSEKGFQQVSFVNSIATTKGGRHVDNVTDQIVSKLIEAVKKKNKGGVNVKPFQIKSHLWVFVNCLIENPTFDSQTKENMTLQAKSFGSKCVLSDKFIQQVIKSGVVESITSWMKFKAQAQLQKKCHSSKHSKLKGIPKLDDANDAGTKFSKDCTLILTEGDSAKSLAVAGLGVVGRDRYGVFPLRGKVLNVREASHKQIMDNAEINNVIKIMGLQFKEKYENPESLKTLRYGKLMIMTDQDQDGSHIKGLLLNFIHHFWPNLLKHNVVNQFITPIVKVTKGKDELAFYSLPEFEEWKQGTDNWHTWKVKYYKGLGTSTSKEAKEYFADMDRHKIDFRYQGAEDDSSIVLAFSKKKIEERKEWLTNWMEERKRRQEMGLPELYLYGKETHRVSYNDFINRELILFSNMDNIRSIPSLVDGLKPGQRKVVFTCLKRNLEKKEIKVAQLAGSVAEHSAYHHGEASLMSTIINLAQNFVGTNNLNLLLPIGQFGTRIFGGKDAASPRYIFTQLSPLTKLVMNPKDDPLLTAQFDDNLRIEPSWYCPIIPMVLINGSDGIGTGWSTKIPNYDIREIVANLMRLMDGEETEHMMPSFKNFKGTIQEITDNRYLISGEISIVDDDTIEITELPVRTWTQSYKEDVMEPMLYGSEKTQPMITDYKEYNTDSTVKFVVKMTPEKLAEAERQGLHKVFKMQTTISLGSMVLFDANGCIKRYESADQIIREFYDLRLKMYQKRKDYLVGLLSAESLKLDNIARFILEKIEGTVVVENKKKAEMIQSLVRRGYDSDPLKAWKAKQEQGQGKEDIDESDKEDEDDDDDSGPDYNYLLGMPLWSLTKERKDDILRQKETKADELSTLKSKTPKTLWKEDLEEFLAKLDEVETLEKEEGVATLQKSVKMKSGKVKKQKILKEETMPSPIGRRIEPRVDTAMKAKAAGGIKKLAKAKALQEGKNLMDYFKQENDDDETTEPKSLVERLNLGDSPILAGRNNTQGKEVKAEGKEVKEKKKRAPRKKNESGSPAKSKSPKKKRNPWSDDEEEEEDEDMDGSFMEVIAPRVTSSRRAAAKVTKYTVDLSDEEAIKSDSDADDEFRPTEEAGSGGIDENGDDDDMDDSFHMPKPAKKPASSKPRVISSDDDDDENEKDEPVVSLDSDEDKEEDMFKVIQPIKKKPAAAAAPKEKKEKKPKASKAPKEPKEKKPRKPKATKKSTDDDGDDDDAFPKPAKKAAKRPAKAAKFSDSDESGDEFMPKKKSTAAKKKKTKTSDDEDDDDFDVDMNIAPRERAGGRERKKVNYNFGSDDDDDDF